MERPLDVCGDARGEGTSALDSPWMALVNSDSRRKYEGVEAALEYAASFGYGDCSGESRSSGGSSGSAATSSSPVATVGAVDMLSIFNRFCKAEPPLALSAWCF